MTAERTPSAAVSEALRHGDIEVLFEGFEPRLIGWTEGGEEVWELVVRFVPAKDGVDLDETSYRFPFTKSALLAWIWGGQQSPQLADGMGPRLASRTADFGAERALGVQYLDGTPTYELRESL